VAIYRRKGASFFLSASRTAIRGGKCLLGGVSGGWVQEGATEAPLDPLGDVTRERKQLEGEEKST